MFNYCASKVANGTESVHPFFIPARNQWNDDIILSNCLHGLMPDEKDAEIDDETQIESWRVALAKRRKKTVVSARSEGPPHKNQKARAIHQITQHMEQLAGPYATHTWSILDR